MKAKKITRVTFKDAIHFTASVVSGVTLGKDKCTELSFDTRGVFCVVGPKQKLVPYGNIKDIDLVDDAE